MEELEYLVAPWKGEFEVGRPEPRCCDKTMEFVFDHELQKDCYVCMECGEYEDDAG